MQRIFRKKGKRNANSDSEIDSTSNSNTITHTNYSSDKNNTYTSEEDIEDESKSSSRSAQRRWSYARREKEQQTAGATTTIPDDEVEDLVANFLASMRLDSTPFPRIYDKYAFQAATLKYFDIIKREERKQEKAKACKKDAREHE